MTVHMDATYSASAYRSEVNDSLPPPRWKEESNRNGIFDTHLAFGNYANLDPEMEIVGQLSIGAEDKSEVGGAKAYCNSMRWQFQNSSRIPYIIFTLRMLCYFFVWIALGVGIMGEATGEWRRDMQQLYTLVCSFFVVAVSVISMVTFLSNKKYLHVIQISGFLFSIPLALYQYGTIFGTNGLQIAIWIGVSTYFMGAVGFNAILWLYSKVFKHDGSEFNRLDGMLRFKRRFRRLFVAPFDEFDPVLQLLPSGYGSHDYALWLHHRYTDNKVCLATRVHSLGLDKANALAFWDCLQRYMDVTQPLPDLPVLEPSRPLDPVTAEHDRHTGRDPHYWRKRTYQGWPAKERKELDRRLQGYPWQQQPCIVRARIDPGLSIEAYYRRQEAKGIFATPRADDFNDEH